MNANHEHELKIAVERIVRPIRAAEKDKLKMREELYAHALDAFAHERSREDQESAAVERAVERLGDPDATRRELQATVGWESRYGYWLNKHLRRPPGVSLTGHAGRIALKSATVFAVYLAVLIVPLRWNDLTQWNSEGRLTVWFLCAINAWFSCGIVFLGTLLGHAGWRLAKRRYARRGDYAKAAGLVLLAAAVVCGLGWCFTYALSFDVAVSFYILRMWLPFSVPLGLSVLFLPHLDLRERRPLAEWLAIDLDAEAAG